MFTIWPNVIFNVIVAIFISELMLYVIKLTLRGLKRISAGIWVKCGNDPALKMGWSALDLILGFLIALSLALILYSVFVIGGKP